jgi:hypothetical protein
MRPIHTLTFLAGAVAVLAAANPSRKTSSLRCIVPTADDSVTIDGLKYQLVEGDTGYRNFVGMAGVDSAALVVVTDTLVCTRVSQVVDSVFGHPTPTTPFLVVLRGGPRYVAFPSNKDGFFYLDTNFVYKHFAP